MVVSTKYRGIATLILLVLDGIWIKAFMGKQYNKLVPAIQSSPLQTNTTSAVLAYALMVIGLHTFVLPKLSSDKPSVRECLMSGFIFGIVVYGIYDFTCGAVFKKWDFKLATLDILWGGLVYFLACYVPQFFL